MTAGTVGAFAIMARDSYGNRRGGGGDSFMALVRSAAKGRGAKMVASATQSRLSAAVEDWVDVTDRGDGTYPVRFVRHAAGLYELRAWLHGEPVPCALLCRVSPGALCVARCTLRGGGVQVVAAGANGELWIEARDACGNVVGVGGERWHVRVEASGPEADMTGASAAASSASMSVRDCGDGLYCASFSVGRAGRYALHVSHADARGCVGAALTGSPFELRVTPSAADPDCIECTPDLQEPLSLIAGQVMPHVVMATQAC